MGMKRVWVRDEEGYGEGMRRGMGKGMRKEWG